MSDDWNVQINAKIGDHLVNVRGVSTVEAMNRLAELDAALAPLHAHLGNLDGRPATEIAAKEWSARSQSRKPAQGGYQRPAPQQPTQPVQTQTPTQLLQQNLGATVVATEPVTAPPGATPGAPQEVTWCGLHNQPRAWAPGGVNKYQKPYGESYRCPAQGCTPKWIKRDGTW